MRNALLILCVFTLFSCNRGASPELLQRANAHFEKREYQQALREYEEILKKDRRNGEICYKIGLTLWELGRGGEAESQFQCAIDTQPENADAYAKLIELYLLSYDHDAIPDRRRRYLTDVEGLTQRLLATQPDSCIGLRGKGQVELLSGHFTDAISSFQKCLGKDPDFEPAVEGLFYALWKSRRSPEAEELALKFIRQYPQKYGVYNALKNTYLSASEGGKAEALVRQRIQTEPGNVHLRFDLARVQILSNRKDAAFATLDQAVADFPKPETFIWAGDAYLEFGEYARAMAAFKEGEKRDAANREFPKRQAVVLAKEGKFDDAAALLAEVLKADPKDWKAETLQISFLLQSRLDSLDGVIARLEKLITAHPQEAEIHALLGWAFDLKGLLRESEQKYREALQINPREFNAQLGISRLLLEKGKAQDAVAAVNSALLVNPESQEARLVQIEALVQLGSYDSARSQLNGILQKNLACQRCQFLLATIDMEERHLSNAEAALRRLTTQGYEPAFEKLAEVDSLQGRASEGLTILKKQSVKDPTNVRLRIAAANMASRANLHDEAIAAITRLSTEFPHRADIRAAAAEIYNRNGNIAAALEQIQEAERLEPEHTGILLQHANLLIQKKDLASAIVELDKILRQTPDHARALGMWARVQTDLKRDSATAVQVARRAYAAGSRDPQVIEDAAYVYLKNGQKDAAISLYRSLLLIDGKNPRHIAGLAEAQRLH